MSATSPFRAYAVAQLHHEAPPGEDIAVYLERIQDTLDPHGGRFVVHDHRPEVVEGDFGGYVVVIGFPDMDAARAWYRSPAYQEILALRTRTVGGTAVLVAGVPPEYDPGAGAARVREAAAERS
ncbi:DUF1330 domain-containing protein [Streptomyces sp. NPDC048172]|uniref:DUF1330 domain-containing protein n=1 Tax=Streptomyces sp. NPDC048172 TaxID=3365505 RepID=UPI0037160BA8